MKAKDILLTLLFISSVILNVVLLVERKSTDIHDTRYETVQPEQDTLDTWQIFTLALMKVESGYNNDVVSSAGAKGYFQMTPIYVREVNRIHKTDFTFEQVTEFETAYRIFDLMQQAHNPDYSLDRALEIHNGDHSWYKKRVYNEMERISNYESLRKKLQEINRI
jgi:hypothetical protein